jgi:preprotein translocase subunit YajC
MEYQRKDLPEKVLKIGFILAGLGLLLVVLSYLVDPQRSAFNNIIGMMFFASISIGALILVGLEYLAGAVWSTPMRRVSEFVASTLPFVVIMAIPLFFSLHSLFHWTHTDVVQSDKILAGKSSYLNVTFFTVRFFIVMLLIYMFYFVFIRNSRKQDVSRDQSLTKTNVKLSAVFMAAAGIGLTILAVDWIMSLEPHWFSTIFGIYFISGTLLAGLAVTTFIAVSLAENGYLPGVNRDHYYSLGALMFAITNFWAYIAFSQFLLIWYANIPEETVWFIARWEGGWKYISIALMIIRFAVPYSLLLSQPSKSDPKRLKQVAVIVLLAHLVDLYWLVMPTFSKTVVLSWTELGFPLLVIGIVIIVFFMQSKKHNLMPIGDPKLERGLDFHL